MPDRRDAGCSGKAGAASGALFEEAGSGLATSAALFCSHGLGGAGISTQWNANLNQCCRQSRRGSDKLCPRGTRRCEQLLNSLASMRPSNLVSFFRTELN